MAKAAAKEPSPQTALTDRYLKLTAKSKAIFREVCEIEDQLLALVASVPEARVPLDDGRTLTRKDNFEGKNTFFKPAASKRFEVVVLPAPCL